MASREELVNALCGGASCSRCGVVGPKEKMVIWATDHPRLQRYYGVELSEWCEYSLQELKNRFDLERDEPRFLLCTDCNPKTVLGVVIVYLDKAKRRVP